MLAYDQKRTQYEVGLKEISRMALKTLFLFEPETLMYDPETDGIKETEEQPLILDPGDDDIYNVSIVWPPPLPVDETIKLSEIQVKQALGLESKVGALRELGEEFPDEKLAELFEERIVDAKQEAAMQVLKAHISAIIMKLTGLVPEGYAEQDDKPKEGEPGKPDAAIDNQPLPDLPSLGDITGLAGDNTMEDIVTMAYGTKLPQRRNINNTDNS